MAKNAQQVLKGTKLSWVIVHPQLDADLKRFAQYRSIVMPEVTALRSCRGVYT
jgi:hypothetical protein